MKPGILIVLASIILLVSSAPMVQADSTKGAGCITHIDLDPQSEHKEGGSKYTASAKRTDAEPEHKDDAKDEHEDDKDEHMDAKGKRMGMGAKAGRMASKEAAHGDHGGKMGGIFFMAPNKVHHLEGYYTEKCGFSLAVYNAFTEPISINRFQAFVKYIPEDEDQLETIRFLSPTKNGSLLQGPGPVGIDGPYEVELYVKFPRNDEPAMFNIPVAEEKVTDAGHDDGDDH